MNNGNRRVSPYKLKFSLIFISGDKPTDAVRTAHRLAQTSDGSLTTWYIVPGRKDSGRNVQTEIAFVTMPLIIVTCLLQWNLWWKDTRKNYPTWQVSSISMLKFNLVQEKCNLDLPTSVPSSQVLLYICISCIYVWIWQCVQLYYMYLMSFILSNKSEQGWCSPTNHRCPLVTCIFQCCRLKMVHKKCHLSTQALYYMDTSLDSINASFSNNGPSAKGPCWGTILDNEKHPCSILLAHPSVTFSLRTVTQTCIAVFSQNFACMCSMSWGCAVYFFFYWLDVVWICF